MTAPTNAAAIERVGSYAKGPATRTPRPSNGLVPMRIARSSCAGHENLTKSDIVDIRVQHFRETGARAAGHSLMSSALL